MTSSHLYSPLRRRPRGPPSSPARSCHGPGMRTSGWEQKAPLRPGGRRPPPSRRAALSLAARGKCWAGGGPPPASRAAAAARPARAAPQAAGSALRAEPTGGGRSRGEERPPRGRRRPTGLETEPPREGLPRAPNERGTPGASRSAPEAHAHRAPGPRAGAPPPETERGAAPERGSAAPRKSPDKGRPGPTAPASLRPAGLAAQPKGERTQKRRPRLPAASRPWQGPLRAPSAVRVALAAVGGPQRPWIQRSRQRLPSLQCHLWHAPLPAHRRPQPHTQHLAGVPRNSATQRPSHWIYSRHIPRPVSPFQSRAILPAGSSCPQI